jgi:hypothetical protein
MQILLVSHLPAWNFQLLKTIEYRVNGAAIPEVDFDIGESYAGLIPTADNNGSMYFWFVPTSHPQGKDDLVIWLNVNTQFLLLSALTLLGRTRM